MTLLDKLDEAMYEPEISQIVILNKYIQEDETIFCFVEGIEDISFYRQYIEKYHSSEIEFINCQGKDNVIQNYNVLDWNSYNKKRVLFFTDKDFDNFTTSNTPIDINFFETEFYSIENYLVCNEVMKKYLIDNCSLLNTTETNAIIEHFERNHIKFTEYLKKISAWMIYCKKKHNIVFSKIKIDEFFKIDHSGDLKKIKHLNKTHFKLLCEQVNNSHFNYNEIKEIYKSLNNYSSKEYIRGKFELHFMFMYLNHINHNVIPKLSKTIKVYNIKNRKNLNRPKVVIQLVKENTFQVLSSKAPEPTKLKDFFRELQN